jgi:hypothetical protein
MALRRNVWECSMWMEAYAALIVIGILGGFLMQGNRVSAGCYNTCANVTCIVDGSSNAYQAPSGAKCPLNVFYNTGEKGAYCRTGVGRQYTFSPATVANPPCIPGAGVSWGCANGLCNAKSGNNMTVTCCQFACQNPGSE